MYIYIYIFIHVHLFLHVYTHIHIHACKWISRQQKNPRNKVRCGNGFHIIFMKSENVSICYSRTRQPTCFMILAMCMYIVHIHMYIWIYITYTYVHMNIYSYTYIHRLIYMIPHVSWFWCGHKNGPFYKWKGSILQVKMDNLCTCQSIKHHVSWKSHDMTCWIWGFIVQVWNGPATLKGQNRTDCTWTHGYAYIYIYTYTCLSDSSHCVDRDRERDTHTRERETHTLNMS